MRLTPVRACQEETMCKRCGKPIDRKAIEADIATRDVPETARRAAAVSVFCSVLCAFEDFGNLVLQTR